MDTQWGALSEKHPVRDTQWQTPSDGRPVRDAQCRLRSYFYSKWLSGLNWLVESEQTNGDISLSLSLQMSSETDKIAQRFFAACFDALMLLHRGRKTTNTLTFSSFLTVEITKQVFSWFLRSISFAWVRRVNLRFKHTFCWVLVFSAPENWQAGKKIKAFPKFSFPAVEDV